MGASESEPGAFEESEVSEAGETWIIVGDGFPAGTAIVVCSLRSIRFDQIFHGVASGKNGASG